MKRVNEAESEEDEWNGTDQASMGGWWGVGEKQSTVGTKGVHEEIMGYS